MSGKIQVSRRRFALLSGAALGGALASRAWGGGSHGFAGLGEDAAGFGAVRPGRRFAFPADHGPHPRYRIEWWYVTANLEDDARNRYGVQWTLFRQALSPGAEREGWASQQVWMGHAAVTSADTHRFAETVGRGGIGQAGARAAPFEVWIDDWSFKSTDPNRELAAATLTASGADFDYALRLAAARPFVLQGDGGYSVKSDQGQASYYYSQPFFAARGVVTIDGREIPVTGRAWMDREWSSQPLAPGQRGWDWFSLHLPEGRKLMLFQLRSDADGPFFSGSWIERDGRVVALARDDIALTPLDEVDVAGRRVPVRWRVVVKSRELDIETEPLNPKSWMGTAYAYWEGPVRFTGTHAGEGYLEMTGY